jgi:hypothetical protein
MSSKDSDSGPHSITLPHIVVSLWMRAVEKFCKSSGKKKIEKSSDLSGYVQKSKTDIVGLWDIFNNTRTGVSHYLKNADRQLSAYLLAFHLPNVARTLMVLKRASTNANLNTEKPNIEIIDLGCGTGALSAGYLFFNRSNLEGKNVKVHLVDKQKKMVQCAAFFAQNIVPECEIFEWYKDVIAFIKNFKEKPDTHIIVLVGNLINENNSGEKIADWFSKICANKTIAANLLFMEPAQQIHSRKAMEFSQYLADQKIFASYPCQNSLKCPMLERSRDWCFSEVSWKVPKEQKLIDQVLKIEHEKVNASAYWFHSNAPELTVGQTIVGKPIEKSGSDTFKSYLLCDGVNLSKAPIKDRPSKHRGQKIS